MEEGERIEVGGKSIKFCGEINWGKTSISCKNRVGFLVNTYHISSHDAKVSLLESENCICSESNSNISGGSEIPIQTKPTIVLSHTTETNSTSLRATVAATKQFDRETQFTSDLTTISLSLLATLVLMKYCRRKGILSVYALGFVILIYQSLLLQYMPQHNSFDEFDLPSLLTNAQIDKNNSSASVMPTKVWYFDDKYVPSTSYNSSKLVQTMNKNEEAVLWILRLPDMTKIGTIAAERMMLGLEKRLQHKFGNNQQQLSSTIRTNITGYLRNMTQDELNNVNPEWKLFISDLTDRGVGPWGLWYMKTELAAILGWKRIHYITRTTQDNHHMDSWATQSKQNSQVASDFGSFAGVPINFTEHLGNSCASVQRSTYGVRDDINDAIVNYMRHNFPSAFEWTNDNVTNSLAISPAVAKLSRPMDIRTFWNATVCESRANRCNFRNYIAGEVASLPSKHPSMKVDTDVIGFIHNAGRKFVSPDYIQALLTTKIIVLAQRDKWEGHLRLMEGLLSGALVLHDPQVYWPYGIVDGVNIVVYHSMFDLEEKILYYLDPANEQERIMIGQRGREIALSKNRFWDNVERLLLNGDKKYVNDYGVSYQPWKGHGNP